MRASKSPFFILIIDKMKIQRSSLRFDNKKKIEKAIYSQSNCSLPLIVNGILTNFRKIVVQPLAYRGRRDRIRDDVRVHAHGILFPTRLHRDTRCVIVNGSVNVTGQGMAAFKADHFPGCGCVPRGWGGARDDAPYPYKFDEPRWCKSQCESQAPPIVAGSTRAELRHHDSIYREYHPSLCLTFPS